MPLATDLIRCEFCKNEYKGTRGLRKHIHSCKSIPDNVVPSEAADKMIHDIEKKEVSEIAYIIVNDRRPETDSCKSPEKKKGWFHTIVSGIAKSLGYSPSKKNKKEDEGKKASDNVKPISCSSVLINVTRETNSLNRYPIDEFSANESAINEAACNKAVKESVSNAVEPRAQIYKKIAVPKALRVQVWNVYIGREIGVTNCPLCNAVEIQQGDGGTWHASHVIAEAKGGKTIIENLRVCCRSCNTSMGTCDMIEYCNKYYPDAIQRLRLSAIGQVDA